MRKNLTPARATATGLSALLLLIAATTACSPPEKDKPVDAHSVDTHSKNPHVIFKTTEGDFTIELYPDKAPITVKNFLTYVEQGFYENTIFHRVIWDFVIQGGGLDENMKQKKILSGIKSEADNGLKNNVGTVAMARASDPHSAASQFFINLKNNDFLNHTGKNTAGWGYCVFGKVVEGMHTVEEMALASITSLGPHQNVPQKPIVVRQALLRK